jgi:hypothetical protein
VLDPRLVEEISAALGTEPGLVEKEWHVVRALGVIASLDDDGARPVFWPNLALRRLGPHQTLL